MKVGSLCTGIAGLEHGVRLAGVDTEPVFVSDIDPGACDWLDQAMPGVPNLGDFTAYDDELPEVDLITAGFPCQPFSTAGKRQGLTDERYLFDDIARLVGRMVTRPLVFLENVPGLLTANGGKAMARVVHGLAEIGYSLTWGTLPASAVGAPHRRLRWWGLAYPADASSLGWQPRPRPRTSEPPSIRRHGPRDDRRAVTADTDGATQRKQHLATQKRATTPIVRFNSPLAANTDRTRLERRPVHPERPDELAARPRSLEAQFGPYGTAISRWERINGRPCPDATDDGRLNPAFVEWMMGYPQGWVTDIFTRRTQSLHALGNAVVPQCAAAAFTQLTQRVPTL